MEVDGSLERSGDGRRRQRDAVRRHAPAAVTSSTMDGAPAADGGPLGGRNLAPRPMEVVLAGTGGCTAYDVVLILRRGRHAVSDCTCR